MAERYVLAAGARDPGAVSRVARRLLPDARVRVEGERRTLLGRPRDFRAIALYPPGGGRLTIERRLDGEPGFAEELAGCRRLAEALAGGAPSSAAEVVSRLSRCDLLVVVGVEPEPTPELDRLLGTLASGVGALVFGGGVVRDGARLLLGAPVLEEAAASPFQALLSGPTSPNPEAPQPDGPLDLFEPATGPGAERVARRALALSATAYRAYLELEAEGDGGGAGEALADLRAWLEELSATGELCEAERTLLDAPIGAPRREAISRATWRTEGAAVLAWALGRMELPALDEEVDTDELWRAVGMLAEGADGLLDEPALRDRTELDAQARRARAVVWRLRRFAEGVAALDLLAALAAEPDLGAGSDAAGLPLANGDLAIAGGPLDAAPIELVQKTLALAEERLAAFDWLLGRDPGYTQAISPPSV